MNEDNHRKYSLEFALNMGWKSIDELLANARKIEQYLNGVVTKNVYVVDIPDTMTPEEAKKYIDDVMARYSNKTTKPDKSALSRVPLQAVDLTKI